jgi:hypothetical protein
MTKLTNADMEDKIQELEARIAKLELAHIEDKHILDTSKPTKFKGFESEWSIPVVDAGPLNKVVKEYK